MIMRAIYKDGSDFVWSDNDVGTKKFFQIKEHELQAFQLYNDAMQLVHHLVIDEGKQFLFARRNLIKIPIGVTREMVEHMTQEEINKLLSQTRQSFYFVGVAGSMVAIFEDGHTEHFTSWQPSPFGEVWPVEKMRQAEAMEAKT